MVIRIFSSSDVGGRTVKCWSLLCLSFRGQRINLFAWVLSGNIKYCILEPSIVWGNCRTVCDSLSWKQSGRKDVRWFCNPNSSLGKGIYLVTIRISDIVGWNPNEFRWWSVILSFSSLDVSGWAIKRWWIQRLGFIGKWFNPCARGMNGYIRYKILVLDWRGTLVDFSCLKHIHRALCLLVQAFCLPRKRVDPLTKGTVDLIEFMSSLGWWSVFLYFGGEWWLTFQLGTSFGKKRKYERASFIWVIFRLAIWTRTTPYFSHVFSGNKRL